MPSMKTPVVVLALLLLASCAGCSESTPGAAQSRHHHSVSAKPIPASTPVSEMISLAASSECVHFGGVFAAMQAAFPAGTSPAATIGVVSKHTMRWSRELDAAANAPTSYGVPEGRNAANELAEGMTSAAFKLGLANLAALQGQLDPYLRHLTAFIKTMSSVDRRCQGY